MLLFTPDEAEVALKLPFQNTPLEEAKSLYPEYGDGIEAILDTMAKRGTVFRDNKPSIGNCCGCFCSFIRPINEN
jgi:hypothetical protein